jgi:hypothetical protein
MSTENRTPTPGKNAWIARPRPYENETVSVNRGPAHTDHGFTRDVYLSQVIDEPGKGGKHPPRREIVTRLHSADAITLGLHLVENGAHAEQRNADEGQGGERAPFFEHPAGADDRRMHEDFARTNLRLVAATLSRLQHWQAQHPDVADYRVTGAITDLTTAAQYLTELADDTVRGRRAASPAEPGARTGHQATDERLAAGEARQGQRPRQGATGRYYISATASIPVTVTGVDQHAVTVQATGDAAKEYDKPMPLLFEELGTWLVLDNEADWVTA